MKNKQKSCIISTFLFPQASWLSYVISVYLSLTLLGLPVLLRDSRCSYSPTERMNTASPCCFSYVSHRIPRGHIVDYFRTSDQCPKHGVV